MIYASPDTGRGQTLSPSLPATQGPKADSKTTQVSIGLGVFLVIGAGLEVGLSYSDKDGLDVYITGGIGYGFGASTKFTGNFNVVSTPDLHLSTGHTATMGMGLAGNFDMKANEFTGISGFAAGGGVLHTGTVTLKGLWRSIFGK